MERRFAAALNTAGSAGGVDLMVRDGWYYCPGCGKKLLRVPSDGLMYGMPVYCRSCKVEWFPTIFEGRELGDDEPFPDIT